MMRPLDIVMIPDFLKTISLCADSLKGMYPGTFYIRAIGRELGEVYMTAKLHKMQCEHVYGS
jgi:hypothetical protein